MGGEIIISDEDEDEDEEEEEVHNMNTESSENNDQMLRNKSKTFVNDNLMSR
jgi:hypothetical protein